ncbi:MAG TPA: hypothetical protein VH088_07770 [Terriglobales bacterium]|nr:hypothetical protein [Terriglobales bacterium]
MRKLSTLFVLLLAVGLTSCGGGGGMSLGTQGSGGSSSTALTSGNWSLVASSVVVSGTTYIGGSLTLSGSSLNAIMHIDNSSCYDLSTDVPFSGSISGTNATLTSSSISGQVITVTGTVSNSTLLQGSYTIAGGCATGDHGSVTGTLVPSISATWKAIDNSSGTTVTITGAITESSTSATDGIYGLSGNITYSGSSCSTGGSITNISFISGDIVAIDAQTTDTNGTTGETQFVGILNNAASPTAFTGNYEILSGACTGRTGTLTFNKQ